MKKVSLSVLCVVFGLATVFGQRAKQNVVHFYDWHLPKKAIAPELVTYNIETIDDKSNTEKLSLRVNDDVYNKYDQVLNFQKSQLISQGLDSYFNLNSFQYKLDKGDGADLNFILGSDKFEFYITAEKTKNSSDDASYVGKLYLISPLKLTVLDKDRNNVVTKIIDERKMIGEKSVKDNASIKDKRIAIKAMIDELVANQKKYFDKARSEYGYNLYKIAAQVKDELDFYREKSKKGVFYKIGKKKGYDLESVNSSIDEIKEFAKLEDSKDYSQKLKELLTKHISFWEAEEKKYNEDDAKQTKIKWALLANIIGAYTVLDSYDQALKYYGDTEEMDYKKDFLPAVIKLGQEHKKRFKLHHDEDGKPYRNYKDISFATTNTVIKKNESLEKGGFRDGYVVTKSGDTIRGKLQLTMLEQTENFPKGSNIVSLDFDSGLGKSVKMTIVNAKGKERSKYFDAKKNKRLVIGEKVFESVKFKEGSMGGSDVDLGKMALAGASEKFALLVYKSDYIAVYRHGSEVILKKARDDKGYSTSSTGYVLSFKKKLAKLVSDCKELSERAANKEFQNNQESLLTFAQEYTRYKSE